MCTFEGCMSKSRAIGLCRGHLNQHYKGQTLKPLKYRRKVNRPVEEALKERSIIDIESGCVIWQGGATGAGYGSIGINGKYKLVHVLAYEIYEGPIPDGMLIDHKNCISTRCWNLSHLRVVTQKQNMENRITVNAKSGYRGVYQHKNGRWLGKVQHNKVGYSTSYFDTAEEAHEAVKNLRLELFTHNEKDRL